MAIKFFGHHLLDENKLTKVQLIKVAEYQSEHNMSLGDLAIKDSLITKKEVEKINAQQRIWDKRFGEVAIELYLLNDEQIMLLLKKQEAKKVFFGEAIVLLGFMSQIELDEELNMFEESQQTAINQMSDQINEIDIHGLVKGPIDILQKLYYRIIRDNIKLTKVSRNESIQRDGILSMQKMRGEENLNFALQPIDNVSLHIASSFLKMPFTKMNEDVSDVLSEFVNILLENISASLIDNDIIVDVSSPKLIDKNDFNYKDYYCFDFSTVKGNLTLSLKL